MYASLFTHLLFSSSFPGIYETRRHLSLNPPLSPTSYLVDRRLIPILPTQQGNSVRVRQSQNKSGALPTKDRFGLRLHICLRPVAFCFCLFCLYLGVCFALVPALLLRLSLHLLRHSIPYHITSLFLFILQISYLPGSWCWRFERLKASKFEFHDSQWPYIRSQIQQRFLVGVGYILSHLATAHCHFRYSNHGIQTLDKEQKPLAVFQTKIHINKVWPLQHCYTLFRRIVQHISRSFLTKFSRLGLLS